MGGQRDKERSLGPSDEGYRQAYGPGTKERPEQTAERPANLWCGIREGWRSAVCIPALTGQNRPKPEPLDSTLRKQAPSQATCMGGMASCKSSNRLALVAAPLLENCGLLSVGVGPKRERGGAQHTTGRLRPGTSLLSVRHHLQMYCAEVWREGRGHQFWQSGFLCRSHFSNYHPQGRLRMHESQSLR